MRIGLCLCRSWAEHIVEHWRDAVSHAWFPALCFVFSLVTSSLISRFAVLTAALMRLVLKHLVRYLTLFRSEAGAGETKRNNISDYHNNTLSPERGNDNCIKDKAHYWSLRADSA